MHRKLPSSPATQTARLSFPVTQQPKYFWVDWPQGMERVIKEVWPDAIVKQVRCARPAAQQ